MFEIGTVVSRGFEGFKANVGPWILSLLAYMGVMIVLQVVNQVVVVVLSKATQSPVVLFPVMLLFSLVGFVIGTILVMGFIHMGLKVARGQPIAVGDLFSQTGKLVPGLIANLIVSIVTGIGFALLCVPGLIAFSFLGLTMFFVVDKELDPISAIKASIAATEGSRGQLILMLIVTFLLILAGELACLVGLFVAAPTALVAWAHIFETLSGKAAAAAV